MILFLKNFFLYYRNKESVKIWTLALINTCLNSSNRLMLSSQFQFQHNLYSIFRVWFIEQKDSRINALCVVLIYLNEHPCLPCFLQRTKDIVSFLCVHFCIKTACFIDTVLSVLNIHVHVYGYFIGCNWSIEPSFWLESYTQRVEAKHIMGSELNYSVSFTKLNNLL